MQSSTQLGGVFVAVFDSEERIVFTNEALEETLALKSKRNLGKSVFKVFANPDLAYWVKNTSSKIADDEVENFYEADLETFIIQLLHSMSNLTSWKEEHDYFVLRRV